MFLFIKCSSISMPQSKSALSHECLNKLYCLFNRHCSHFSAHGTCHENVCKNNGLQSCSSTHWHLIIINLCVICDYKTTEICYCEIGCQVIIVSPELYSLHLRCIMKGFFFMTPILMHLFLGFVLLLNQVNLTTGVSFSLLHLHKHFNITG